MEDFITERQKNILDSVIENYIELAHPISSKFLEEMADFGFSSATIRAEMFLLTQMGYLEQFHISAGRIPSDRGYRFFVGNIKENKKGIPQKIVDFLKEFKNKKNPDFDDFDNLTKEISFFSKVFTSFSFPDKKIYFENGWQFLKKEPESEQSDFWKEITCAAEEMEDLINKMKFPENSPTIMIGDDTPFGSGKNLSFIGAPIKFEDSRCFFYLLGPKRMDYEKNLGLAESIIKIFNYGR
ncbi:MAG: hypothetical protein Q8O39_00365 [bacterium]|nr:hypothetical protein [bacterium]